MDNRLIFHIDVNSAYLSWTAVDMLQHGFDFDIRKIPSVVAGDPKNRHGIILAKSIPAKKYKITTGEPLYSALQKCPQLYIAPPCYDLFVRCSDSMVNLLKEYTPNIQRFSVDECFLDFTGMGNLYPDCMELANEIKDRIKEELGFTVSIGVSCNKLLAKVASDIKKPDAVISLFPSEIKEKMWPLDVGDLFMVGRATLPKLNALNIFTIGDLANYDVNLLKTRLKSYGVMIWNYANGIENSQVRKSNHLEMKGIGNSTTIPFNVETKEEAYRVILSLCETIAMRLRNSENFCSLVSVSFRTSEFYGYGKQKKLHYFTDSTMKIAEEAYKLFDELWHGEPLRHIGVQVTSLTTNEFYQTSLFDEKNIERERTIDKTIDSIRSRYGSKSIYRCTFLQSGLRPLTGGVNDNDYPIMLSRL